MIRLTDTLVRDMFTLDSLYAAGWTDETLVAHGLATRTPDQPAPIDRCQRAAEAVQVATGCSDATKTLIRQTLQRDTHGQQKYGTNLDRTDLSLVDWLQHQSEELADGAGYALAAKREAERLMAIVALRQAVTLS